MPSLTNPLTTLGISLGAALSLHFLIRRALESTKPPLPPSPWSYPLIGHLLSIPRGDPHLGFIEIGKQLKTNLFSLTVLGETMIILNSENDAINLLQNRSGIYSDRPNAPMLTEPSLMDASGVISALKYGDRWRKCRRLMHPWLHKQAIEVFDAPQQQDTRVLLQRLLRLEHTSSETLYRQVFTALSGTLLYSIYGYQINGEDDPFLKEAILCAHHLSEGALPTNFLVNVFPSLRYVPSWFPGANWKRIAREWREQKENITANLLNITKEGIASGNYEPSIIASLLTDAEKLELSLEEVDDYAGQIGITLYVAGAETTSNVILIFVLAMMLHPEMQQRAQSEIDNIVGDSRLPVMEDRHQLPYINSLIQEILRWCPIVPLGAPHAASEDDVYQGFRIPKGAMIVGNAWAMSRNEEVYGNPEEFNPDRFLNPSVPPLPIFGFGRRECPGNHFAESSLFILIASILATFNVSMPKNERGETIVPKLTSKSGIIIHPDEFQLRLEPRSASRVNLVNAGA